MAISYSGGGSSGGGTMGSSPNGQNVGQIFLQLNLQSNITQQIQQQSQQAAQQATNAFSNMGSSLMQIGSRFMKLLAVGELIKFGKQAIEVASDLEEVQNVVDVAFGDMADQAEAFAKTASEQFGISELSAKKMSSTFMSMSKGMGLSGDAAAKMSINVTKLSADVASFYNLTSEEASNKLKAIWTGESEGLKTLGVVMSQTNLERYAQSKGIQKNIKDMDQAEQTMLRYNFVMDQLSLAQGDFARTSDSWSNSVKAMGENFKSAMGNIGTILIQALTPALQVLSELVAKFKELTEMANRAVSKFFGKEDTQETVKSIEEAGDQMSEAVEDSNKKIQKAAAGLASFDEIFTIGGKKEEAASNESALAAFGDIEDYKDAEKEREGILDKFYNKIKEIYEKKIKPVATRIYETFVKPIVDAFSFCWNYIKSKVDPMVEVFKGLWDSVKKIFIARFNAISHIFKGVWEDLKTFWEKYGKPIFTGIIDGVVALWQNVEKFVAKIIVPIFEHLFATLTEWWDQHGRPLFQTLLGFLGKLGVFLTTLWNKWLMPLFSWLIDTFGPFVVDMVNAVIDAFSFLGGIIADILKIALSFFGSILDGLTDLVNNGIVKTFQDLVTELGNLFGELWEIIKTPINWIIEGINKIIDGINSIHIDIPDWSPFHGGETIGFNIPRIPLLANGGIVDQPTLNVAGEAGPEAIAPIDKLGDMIADAVAKAMTPVVAAMNEVVEAETSQPIQLVVNFGNKQILDEVINGVNRRTRINGRPVIVNR